MRLSPTLRTVFDVAPAMVGGVAPQIVSDDARMPRVRFVRSVRVTLIDGAPRSYRVQSRNLSGEGIFLEMPMPIEAGTRVALSLEAGEQVLPFARGVVVWQREFSNPSLARRAGFAVKFTGFLHPRAAELTRYLCESIASGRLLRPAPPRSKWRTHGTIAAAVATVAIGVFGLVNAIAAPFAMTTPAVAATQAVEMAETPRAAPLALDAELAGAPPLPATQTDEELQTPRAPPVAPAVSDLDSAAATAGLSAPEHSVSLPSGAATALTWDGAHDEFRVAPALSGDAKTTKIYLLSDPPRLVFDIDGAAPVASHSLASGERLFERIRVGRQAKATRLVVDLAREPKSFVDEDGAAIVSF